VLPLFKRKMWLEEPLKDPHVIGFGSTKGGAGRTTMAIEIGSLISFISEKKTAIIDWDVVNPRLTQRAYKSLPMRGQTLVKVVTAKNFERALKNVSLHEVSLSQTSRVSVFPALSYEDIDNGTVDEYFNMMYEKPEEYIKRCKTLIKFLRNRYEYIINDYPAITWVALGHLTLSINMLRVTAGNLVIVVDSSPWSAELLSSKLILPKIQDLDIGALVVNMVKPSADAVNWAKSVFRPVCERIKSDNFVIIPFDPTFYDAGIGRLRDVISVSVSPIKAHSRSARYLYPLVDRFLKNEKVPKCWYIGPQ
jgi:MinD-like ATPase involved in chromosome partitioning or flagellar assembly